MAILALRGSGRVKWREQTARRSEPADIPAASSALAPGRSSVGSVNQRIHVPTWDSVEADTLWTTACGKKRWRGDRAVEDDIRNLTDEQIWQMRSTERKALIGAVA